MSTHNLEEGQIVSCIVERIVGTTVFVKIEGNVEGTVTLSEIAPGRIRNLREYVIVGKSIVCKILKIQGDKMYLSLRRVKQNEKKELLEKIAKERSYQAILKTVLQDKADEIINKITESYSLIDFFEEVKKNQKILEKYLDKTSAGKITTILETKKDKAKELKKIFQLASKEGDGIKIVKKILTDSLEDSHCKITYIAAGKFRLTRTGQDFKEMKNDVNKVMDLIEKQAKKHKCDFSAEKN